MQALLTPHLRKQAQRSSETYPLGSGETGPSSWKVTPSQLHASLSFRPRAICSPESPSITSQSLGPSTAPNSSKTAGCALCPSPTPSLLPSAWLCFSQGPFRVNSSLPLQSRHRHQHQTDLGSKLTMLPAGCASLDKSLCFSEHGVLSYGGHRVIGRQS